MTNNKIKQELISVLIKYSDESDLKELINVVKDESKNET